MDLPTRARVLLLAAAVWLAVFLVGLHTFGVASARAEEEESPEEEAIVGESVFPPPDRATLRLLAKAEKLVDEGRYVEAVRCLGTIFEGSEDYFFRPDRRGSTLRSLKSEAQRLLGAMPARGREQYELQYGVRARRMLSEAVAAGDPVQLAEVARRFFHTKAGYEATWLLGRHHFDRGQPLAGALVLERLRGTSAGADRFEPVLSLWLATCWLRAGMPQKASRVLVRLEERFPKATVRIGGKSVDLFAKEADPIERLTSLLGRRRVADASVPAPWLMFRGDVARGSRSGGGGPLLNVRWRVPTSCDPAVEASIARLRRGDRTWERAVLPAVHPLVVDGVLLMRTAHNLLAVDFATGKRIWEVPSDDPFGQLSQLQRAPQFEYALRLRMWADATYGTMSSDQTRVFVVEDLALEIGRLRMRPAFFNPRAARPQASPIPCNRLAAYDIRSGKLQWHLGGGKESLGLAEAGTFFLGPPLPLMGRLYVIAESMGEIRLLALEGKTGKLLWSQQLAGTDQSILANDPLRRMAGASPSYADGILVCPTSNRSIVAVELATRSLLWGYSYPQSKSEVRPHRLLMGMGMPMLDVDPVGRWPHSTVVVAEGLVLATPVDSDSLHAIRLLDGKLLWRQPREDAIYLACTHQGKAVLVGPKTMRAVELHRTRAPKEQADDAPPSSPLESDLGKDSPAPRPEPAWSDTRLAYPSGALPTGMGFRSGDLYYLPLGTGEVMAVDLRTGRLGRRYRSRRGNVPGNLLCCEGKMISQDAGGVEAYFQLDALKSRVDDRLAARGDDAEALALLGEILWDAGKLEEAIENLKHSLAVGSSQETRNLLREAFLEGLRVDFAAHRKRVGEIEPLLDEPAHRASFLRLMATGLEEAAEFDAALENYLELIGLDRNHGGMEPIDESHSVRRSHWLNVRLAALRERTSDPIRAKIDRIVAARLEAATREKTPESLKQFLGYFGAMSAAEEARRGLIGQLIASGKLIEAELLLLGQGRADNGQKKAESVAQLAQMFREAGYKPEAAHCYNRLRQEFADTVCSETKTGSQLVEALPAADPVREQLESTATWPLGAVHLNRTKPKQPPRVDVSQASVLFTGTPATLLDGMTFELLQNPFRFAGRDALGNSRWSLSLVELVEKNHFVPNLGAMRASACGHLLLLSSGQGLLAIDLLGNPDHPTPTVLWSRGVDEPATGSALAPPFRPGRPNPFGAAFPVDMFGNAPEAKFISGVINEQVCCFQEMRSCVAVEPSTGKTLWVRGDIPVDSHLFGDYQHVFLVPQDATTATVFRASDGTVEATREIPLERCNTYGRRVLLRRTVGAELVLELFDPWEQKTAWTVKKLHSASTVDFIDEEAVAVHEPTGRCVVIAIDDGRIVIDAKLESDHAYSERRILRTSDGYLVLAYDGGAPSGRVPRTHALHGVASVRVTRGLVRAFDSHGKQLWTSPRKVENQWLPLNQPRDLPILTFACLVQPKSGNRQTEPKASILALDKRTGHVALREDLTTIPRSFHQRGDPRKNTVEILLHDRKITMTFTNEPIDPGDEAADSRTQESPTKGFPAPKAPRAVFDALRRALQETL